MIGGKKHLVYHEDPLQKTNQGSLVCKGTNEVVYVYEASDRNRCPVNIYEKYCGLLPVGKSCSQLYLQPKIKFTPKVWYCDQPYSNNKVGKTVRELCDKAEFEGKITNHSLRATSASRMYQNNIPEQVIKEVTGHKSDCVHVYKRTSDNIREDTSKTIAGSKSNKCQKVGDEQKVDEPETEKVCGDKEFENL